MVARPSDPSAERLVHALTQTGQEDQAAFRRLYGMTSAKLFGVCLRICGERKAAEDVLQEVYLIIWRRAGAFDPDRASPMAWLCTIARNRAIDYRRSLGRHMTFAADGMPEQVDPTAGTIDVLLQHEARQRLHVCLDDLPERPRTMIRTAFYDGLSYAELAQQEGVPLATMKSWVRRGLLRLRECLHDDA